MQITVRKPAVAGLFYPESQRECRAMVDRLLIENPCEQSFDHIKGVVVPHAGYVYSGAVAAKAFNLLSKQAQQFNKVVLLGPSHRVPLMGMSFSHFDAFHTPLGNVPLAVEEIHRLSEKHHIPIDELPHEYEHSLEVELPFLQVTLNEFSLIPIVVGQTSPESVAALLSEFWDQEQTLIMVSSDLSHYLRYDQAQQVDTETCRQIINKSTSIKGHQACGCYPLNGLLLEASRNGANVDCLALANSGDTAGDKSRVVGYGAYVIH